MPRSACWLRREPSNPNGFVTTPTVRASSSRASSAITGAAPVPVPPPSPAVTNTMSAPLSASFNSSRVSIAASRPTFGIGACAEPASDLRADVDLDVRVGHEQRLRVGVHGDELHAAEARIDHAIDRVRPGTADADDLDYSEVRPRAFTHRHQRDASSRVEVSS